MFSVSVTICGDIWNIFSEQNTKQKLAFYFTNFASLTVSSPLFFFPSFLFYSLLCLSLSSVIIIFWLVYEFYKFFLFIFSQKQILKCLIVVAELCWLSVKLYLCFNFLHLLLKFVMVLLQVTLRLLATEFVSRFLSTAAVIWGKKVTWSVYYICPLRLKFK